jgi:hypothetical protein
MSEPSPRQRVERAVELLASSTMRIEQNVRIPSRGDLQSAVLTGCMRDGAATGLALEGGGESLTFWIGDEQGAIDLRPVGAEALESLSVAIPGIDKGLVQWDRSNHQAERTLRELLRLHLTCDPARWLHLFEVLADGVETNPEQAASVLVGTPVWRLLELLGLPPELFDDIVRKMALDNGMYPADEMVRHLVNRDEPRVGNLGAAIAAAFAEDGSIHIVQIVVDLAPWLHVVRPDLVPGDTFPIVAWQTYEPVDDDESVHEVAFPGDAPDITASLGALVPPDEEIRQLLAQEHSAPGAASIPDGSIRVDPNMIEDLRSQSGAMYFVLSDADPVAAPGAISAMIDAVRAVRHPDEPTEALASYVSAPTMTDDGGWFFADISDMEEEDEILVELVAGVAVAAEGLLEHGTVSATPPASETAQQPDER